jgi:hypothetical protein
MNRDFYLDLARAGTRMPLGTDLVLHEHADADAIRHDGPRLGEVILEAAQRYRTPLAVPLMDLTLEKAAIVELLGVAEEGEFHFESTPDEAPVNRFCQRLAGPLPACEQTYVDAIGHVARANTVLAVGMCIGPVSLMTKLLADPITPITMAGGGASGEDEPEVRRMEVALDLATRTVLRVIEAQIAVGAKAVMIAEPAANMVYFSPRQIRRGADVFERYALAPNRQVRAALARHGVDLLFHCCGELIDEMVRGFASLDPAVLSLGSSRTLWQDAALVPPSTVLFGNLPSKRFYSDTLITVDQVRQMSAELIARMRAVGHPFILGTECDVLHVPGCEHSLRAKVKAMLAVRSGDAATEKGVRTT